MPLLYWLRRVIGYRQPASRQPGLPYPLVAILGLSSGVFADTAEQDLANERFYTPPAAMEHHWRVDCAMLESRIGTALQPGDHAPGQQAAIKALLGELHKCAMIYNTPGTTAQHRCPDYAAGHSHLQQWLKTAGATPDSPSSTAALQLILQALHCPPQPESLPQEHSPMSTRQ